MSEKNLILCLLEEMKHYIIKIDELELRVELLERANHITPEIQPHVATNLPKHPILCTEEITVKHEDTQPTSRSTRYFSELNQNEDGLIYVEDKNLKETPDNYEIVANDGIAEVRFTSDAGRISKMLDDYVKYFQDCKRINKSSAGCRVETVSPGRFVLEDGRWYQEEKITIKFI